VTQIQKNHNSLEYYDISPEISALTAVFPGDTQFSRKINMSFEGSDHLDLSEITTTVHIGAHTDAPSHYHGSGSSIEKRKLHYYMGPCQIVTVEKNSGERILPEDLEKLNIIIKQPRVLFKTNSFPDPNKWTDAFVSLSPELIKMLHQSGVILVGIDTPSVDPATDQGLSSHKEIFESDMAILEGVVLSEVPDGDYNLIALPLKIKNADASPVRAILTQLENK
jgi:arylformamidase